MTPTKRLFDILAALFLAVVLAVPFGVLLIYVVLREGRPVFYISERMRAPERPFQLYKLRTMRVVSADSGVSGGDKADRVTPVGAWLRKYRADEVPQLWNVLKGDMSFVGPRPPLRLYVERYPELYETVLKCRPGVTGMATLYFHAREEQLLRNCSTPEHTDEVYCRRCIPRKAYLDQIYARNRNLCMDIVLMINTVRGVARKKRKKRVA